MLSHRRAWRSTSHNSSRGPKISWKGEPMRSWQWASMTHLSWLHSQNCLVVKERSALLLMGMENSLRLSPWTWILLQCSLDLSAQKDSLWLWRTIWLHQSMERRAPCLQRNHVQLRSSTWSHPSNMSEDWMKHNFISDIIQSKIWCKYIYSIIEKYYFFNHIFKFYLMAGILTYPGIWMFFSAGPG